MTLLWKASGGEILDRNMSLLDDYPTVYLTDLLPMCSLFHLLFFPTQLIWEVPALENSRYDNSVKTMKSYRSSFNKLCFLLFATSVPSDRTWCCLHWVCLGNRGKYYPSPHLYLVTVPKIGRVLQSVHHLLNNYCRTINCTFFLLLNKAHGSI